ncbi:MAG: choice-of-anchor Q domain-containing protein [Deinococcota bacterium]
MNLLFTSPRLKKASCISFLILGLSLLISVSFAQVTNLNDTGAGSLRDTIAAALDGDTITFQAGLSGTINTASTLTTALDDLTLDATGATITIDGQNSHQILEHTGTGTLEIINLTFQNGSTGGDTDGGAIESNNANIIIIKSTFRNNFAGDDGGAIEGLNNITITSSTFFNNRANDDGGAVRSAGAITIINSAFSENSSVEDGGAVEGNTTDITSTTFTGNTSGEDGGAIYSENNLTITESTFSGNTSDDDGGAVSSNNNILVTKSTFSGNSSVADGGAVEGNTTDITSTIFTGNNSGEDGGAIYSENNLTITESTFSGNTSDDDGGAVSSNNDIMINNSTFAGNSAAEDGGAIEGDDMTITDSTISENAASDNGGGIFGGDIIIVNSTIMANTSLGFGGGISSSTVDAVNTLVSSNRSNTDGGGLDVNATILTNSTVVANIGGDGGGIWSDVGGVTLDNSLVLGNDAPANSQIRGAITNNNSAYGFSVGESTGDAFVGLDMADVFVDPISAAAAPTTAGNYRLIDTSPALDSGDNTLIPVGIVADLDGGARILDGVVDMGAYEGIFTFLINPNQDIQIRNGNSTAAASITSNSVEVLSYGPFNRNQNVVLEYLIRNPGARTLELGELVLPSFLSVVGDALPETLGSFDSALLEVSVDTSIAGTLAGQVSLASNDPDANENPFVFNLIVRVGNEPANALYVLPGIDLADTTITPSQQNVPVFSAYLIVPEGSANVTINSLTLNTDDIPALRDVTSLTLLIDGGTRGIQDSRDVVLSTVDAPTVDGIITFEFNERTLQPNLPFWVLVTADF